jgi:hypothetical protein
VHEREISSAEVVFTSLVTTLAALVVVAYGWDLAGFVLRPAAILLISTALGAAAFAWGWPRSGGRREEVAVVATTAAAVFAWLLWLAWPSLLPPGGGPDLTHHLILIDFIERHWRLVHDPAVETYLGEMVAYTPGSHLLAAMAGAWTGRDGLHTLYPVVALTVALKAALVFLIAERAIGSHPHRVPLAAASVVLLMLPQAYLAGSFAHDSFVAQVVSELFAVAMLWALIAWDQTPSPLPLVVFGAAGSAAFLTWPVWVGAPMATLLAVVVTHRDLPLRDRVRHLVFAVGPIALVGAVYVASRLGWITIAGTSGAVLEPSIAVYGWTFLVFATTGLVLAAFDRRRRALLIFVFALAGQTMALLMVARRNGADTPYMALKMAYLAIYPQAVAGAVAVAGLWDLLHAALAGRGAHQRKGAALRAWVPALLLACAALPSAATFRGASKTITEDLARSGQWARANVPPDCVDYLVSSPDAAYWLHLSALGNPRMSDRTAALSDFNLNAAIGRWVSGEDGPTYAIADMAGVPNAMRDRFDMLASFGSAAVIKRRGPSTCPGR